jgi:hypothetical protein
VLDVILQELHQNDFADRGTIFFPFIDVQTHVGMIADGTLHLALSPSYISPQPSSANQTVP